MTEGHQSQPALPLDIAAASRISGADDTALQAVRAQLLALDPQGLRFADVLRSTIDQLLDGENTGRYDWNDLHKTEKTHAGTLIEINLLRAFDLSSGHDLDYSISGHEVDCKYSQTPYGWMIPPEALDEICLVIWADDFRGRWSAGLFRASGEKLTKSGNMTKRGNRDGKYRLTKENHSMVQWLWEDATLPENLLLHLDRQTRNRILTARGKTKRGDRQARVSELFRSVQQKRIDRTAVRTLAQQKDYMKRVRYDGGARSKLRPEGTVIFGHQHRDAAERLGIPVPRIGEFVSVQVKKADQSHTDKRWARLDGDDWVVAESGDPAEEAPCLPAPKKGSADDD